MTELPTWPIAEVFGPTIQGEGYDQGVGAYFVRFAGCDYKCSWCDSPHAVTASSPDWNPSRLNARQIIAQLAALPHGNIRWVVLSGGNPLLYDLTPLVQLLKASGYLIAVETQGTKYQEWINLVDRMCVSPKPPSSGMTTNYRLLSAFTEEHNRHSGLDHPADWMFLKVAVFDARDLRFAADLHFRYPSQQLFLVAGNDPGRTVKHPRRQDVRNKDAVRADLLGGYQRLVEMMLACPTLGDPHVIVQAQMHVLAWGNERGR